MSNVKLLEDGVDKLSDWENITSYANANLLPSGLGAASGTYSYYYVRRIGAEQFVNFRFTTTATAGTGTDYVEFPTQYTNLYDTDPCGTVGTYNVTHSNPSTTAIATTSCQTVSSVNSFRFSKLGAGIPVRGSDLLASAQIKLQANYPVSEWQ